MHFARHDLRVLLTFRMSLSLVLLALGLLVPASAQALTVDEQGAIVRAGNRLAGTPMAAQSSAQTCAEGMRTPTQLQHGDVARWIFCAAGIRDICARTADRLVDAAQLNSCGVTYLPLWSSYQRGDIFVFPDEYAGTDPLVAGVFLGSGIVIIGDGSRIKRHWLKDLERFYGPAMWRLRVESAGEDSSWTPPWALGSWESLPWQMRYRQSIYGFGPGAWAGIG